MLSIETLKCVIILSHGDYYEVDDDRNPQTYK